MKQSTKTLSMSLSEYEQDLNEANASGYGQALAVLKHVLEGKTVKRSDQTTPEEWEVWSLLQERLAKSGS
jgi:hypothetical protein